MKKFSFCLFVLTAFILLVSCGGVGGGGGGGAAGGSADDGPSGGSAVGATYAPAYIYNVPEEFQTSSYTIYTIRRSYDGRSLNLSSTNTYAQVANSDFGSEQQFNGKSFVQNTDEWPVPEAGFITRNRFWGVQSENYVENVTEKDFWFLSNFANDISVHETFKLKKIGTHCRVWYRKSEDESSGSLTDNQLETIKDKLDAMFAVETALCGSMETTRNWSNIISIPSGSKLEIVVYSMGENYLGYFHPRDFNITDAKSNKAPIIYISSTDTTSNMYSTVSHELNHLLNYIKKTVNNNLHIETWYTELLSNTIEEVLENFNGVSADDSVRKDHLPVFLCSYNRGLFWNQDFQSYSNVFAFGAWLLRNYGGASLFQKIATNNLVQEASIEKAVRDMGYNETFDSLRLKFAESLIFTEYNCGKPNFNKRIYDTGFFSGVTIDMPEINLMSITSISSASADNAAALVNCSAGASYKGPLILKPDYHFQQILPYGFELNKLGTGDNVQQIQIPSEAFGRTSVEFK